MGDSRMKITFKHLKDNKLQIISEGFEGVTTNILAKVKGFSILASGVDVNTRNRDCLIYDRDSDYYIRFDTQANIDKYIGRAKEAIEACSQVIEIREEGFQMLIYLGGVAAYVSCYDWDKITAWQRSVESDVAILSALRAAGVDNWEGYSEAMRSLS